MQESPVPHVHLSISVTDLEIDPADPGNINSDHPSVLFPLLFIFSLLGVSISIITVAELARTTAPFCWEFCECFLVYLLMCFPDAQNRTQASYQANITTAEVDRGFSLMHFTSQLKWVTGTCK